MPATLVMLLAIRGHPDGNVDTSREPLHPTDRQNPERAKGEKSQPCRVGMLARKARFDVQEIVDRIHEDQASDSTPLAKQPRTPARDRLVLSIVNGRRDSVRSSDILAHFSLLGCQFTFLAANSVLLLPSPIKAKGPQRIGSAPARKMIQKLARAAALWRAHPRATCGGRPATFSSVPMPRGWMT